MPLASPHSDVRWRDKVFTAFSRADRGVKLDWELLSCRAEARLGTGSSPMLDKLEAVIAEAAADFWLLEIGLA